MDAPTNIKRRKILDTSSSIIQNSLILDLPFDIIDTYFLNNDQISKQDLINISSTNHQHRAFFFPFVFSHLKLSWLEFNDFQETYKFKKLINSIRVHSNLSNLNQTKNGEWNISLKNILLNTPNLTSLCIETLSSSRFLKYQDNFSTKLSNKVHNMSLISHSDTPNDESLFELTQIKKFNKIKKLSLNGYLLTKDIHYIPKITKDKNDDDDDDNESELTYLLNDGKLIDLVDLTLINCKWEHPFNLSDMFSPVYNNLNSSNCSLEKISIYYSNQFTSFLTSERFKSFLNLSNDDTFYFQLNFWKNLKSLNLVILNDNYDMENNKYIYYYPYLNWINLSKVYSTKMFNNGNNNNEYNEENEHQSIITNLHELSLVGWRLNNLSELDHLFTLPKSPSGQPIKFNLKKFKFYLMKNGIYNHLQYNTRDLLFMENIKHKVKSLLTDPEFNNNYDIVKFEIGFIDECFDGRYKSVFDKHEH